MVVALVVTGLAIAGAGATFGYQKLLETIRDKKAEELAAAEASISRETVDEFLRLQGRLNATEDLLDKHIALSRFFTVLETLTLQTVSFNSLDLKISDTGAVEFGMEGSARSFNALAAQSSAFAADRRIREAIFSDIKALPSGVVEFSLSAEIDPALIAWEGVTSIPEPPAVAATTTEQ